MKHFIVFTSICCLFFEFEVSSKALSTLSLNQVDTLEVSSQFQLAQNSRRLGRDEDTFYVEENISSSAEDDGVIFIESEEREASRARRRKRVRRSRPRSSYSASRVDLSEIARKIGRSLAPFPSL